MAGTLTAAPPDGPTPVSGRPAVLSRHRGGPTAFFHQHRRLPVVLLLLAPLFWLVFAYLNALFLMLESAFYSIDPFTGLVIHNFTTDNFSTLLHESVFRAVTVRTIWVAVLVTVVDAVVAVPMAMFMSLVARPRLRRMLVVAVLTPLWASYLVKAYAWRSLLAPDGPLSWVTGGATPSYGLAATVVTLAYLWLPYMVLPVYAGFERLPRSLLEASADLGGRTWRTVRSVVLPLIFPAIAAGSIFTFSLTLGDYIAVTIVGGKTQLLANVIYGQLVTANNRPLAAALSLVPLVAILLYLAAMRRTGALENV